MKKLFAFILLFLTFSSNAQIIGLQGGASLTFADEYGSLGLGSSSGIFYSQKIYKRLWINTGVYTSCWTINPPVRSEWLMAHDVWYSQYSTLYILEIPAELRLRLNPSEDSKVRSFVTVGYNYGQMLGETVKVIDPYIGNYSYPGNITSDDKHTHNIETFGYELQYLPKNGFFFAWGVQYKYTVFRNKQYGDLNNWNAYVKLGYNLRSGKK